MAFHLRLGEAARRLGSEAVGCWMLGRGEKMLIGEDDLMSDWGKEAGPCLEVKPKLYLAWSLDVSYHVLLMSLTCLHPD